MAVTAAQWNERVQHWAGSFLQSWQWGDFQHAYGRRVHRLHTDQWLVQLITHHLPAGRAFLFAPYGPVGQLDATTTPQLIDQLQAVAQSDQAIFLRYERGGSKLGGQPAAAIHPTDTWVLPLTTADQLLAGMKPKWRYNIKVAQRHKVIVHSEASVQAVDEFYRLASSTAQRQQISLHPKSYYQLMIDQLGKAGMATVYLAKQQEHVIAAAIMVLFGHTMTYLHGGSDYAYHHAMAPHLLHWQAMQDARQRGLRYYDFFGIAPASQPNHPWAGISRFKQGFGGAARQYDGTYELVFQPTWYSAYRLVKRLWT
ncbi:MAG: peptidoglycan bridge formation glycyltransferase FemA/FemB family protein [Candidatus Kerfeldbacteria bacterium]|nr:peptidoglycan bridge formation glycyltransferase FemA/FemB family protein [Candidatus Kerfeldbacteria bacterium]